MTNQKQTGSKISSLAGKTLGNANASQIQKSLAGSALAQSGTSKTTSKSIEAKASTALHSQKSNSTTKSLAGSVVSQSNRKP
jgi:hypothetical protein